MKSCANKKIFAADLLSVHFRRHNTRGMWETGEKFTQPKPNGIAGEVGELAHINSKARKDLNVPSPV